MSMPSDRDEFIQGCELELARLEKAYGINTAQEDDTQRRREQMFVTRYGMARLLTQLKGEAQLNLIVDADGAYSRTALLARVNGIAEGLKEHVAEQSLKDGEDQDQARSYGLREACNVMREHLESLLSTPAK
ncbi:MAG: hypothetical protein RSD49_12035 [Hafnia sp.]